MVGFRDWTRDDPVRDAERWFSRENNRPVMCQCAECGGDIHNEDDYYEADVAYLFDNGDVVCSGCLVDYCNSNLKL